MARVTQLEAETYTFVLTGGDGSRTLGFCRRFLPPGAGPRHPQVLCLLSIHPWFSLFSTVLQALEPYAFPLADSPVLSPLSPIAAVLHALCAAGTPAPGAALPPPRVAGGPGLPSLRAPVDRGTGPANADVFFAPLLWRVPVPTALNLFAAMLAERRIIITAKDLSALSAAVHAAAAMLYPLTWQHIFVPLLPASLLDYLTAPMPFLVGVPAALAPAMRKMPMEETVLLNLDTGVIECFAEDLALLPRTSGSRLAAELSDVLKSRVHNDAAVAGALRTFFLHTLGDVRRFVHHRSERLSSTGAGGSSGSSNSMGGAGGSAGSLTSLRDGNGSAAAAWTGIPADALRSGDLWFDHGAYCASTRSPSTAAFRSALRATQMFESFITRRLDGMAQPQGEAAQQLAADAFEMAVRNEHTAHSDGRLAKGAEAAKLAASAAAAAAAKRVSQAWGFAQRAGDRMAEGMERVIDPVLESAEKRARKRSNSNENLTALSSAGQAGGQQHAPFSPLGTVATRSFSFTSSLLSPSSHAAPAPPVQQAAATSSAAAGPGSSYPASDSHSGNGSSAGLNTGAAAAPASALDADTRTPDAHAATSSSDGTRPPADGHSMPLLQMTPPPATHASGGDAAGHHSHSIGGPTDTVVVTHSRTPSLTRSESISSVDFDSEVTVSGADASLLLSRMADHAKVVIKAAPHASSGVPSPPTHPTLSALLGASSTAESSADENGVSSPPVFEFHGLGLTLNSGFPPRIAEEESRPSSPQLLPSQQQQQPPKDPYAVPLGDAPASANGTRVPPVAALVEQFGALGLPVPPTPRALDGSTPDDWAELVQWAEAHALPGTPRAAAQVSLLDA